MAPIDMILVGAGNRGALSYGPYAIAHPEDVNFVAVADPDNFRRERFGLQHEIEPERRFESWQALCAQPRMARAALNCSQDRMHIESTLALLRAGYDVLLEKPMATNAADCIALVEAAEKLGRTLQICHVMRFVPLVESLFDIVRSGELGEIVTIDHRENVSWWHMSHSFVRGNWGVEAESNPMILAKCCHDLDLLLWVMGQPVTRLSSFGGLAHYRPEHAPAGAPKRCTDGCPVEDSCIWSAPRLYGAKGSTSAQGAGWKPYDFMLTAAFDSVSDTPHTRLEKLRTSPYGRCVFQAGNDVVDHQVINMEFAGGATCTFTMHGHSAFEGRTFRWDGTKATLHGTFVEGQPYELRIVKHGGKKARVIRQPTHTSGHGGGDEGLMINFVKAMRSEPSRHQTTARVSLASHLVAFAAEESRKTGRVITL